MIESISSQQNKICENLNKKHFIFKILIDSHNIPGLYVVCSAIHIYINICTDIFDKIWNMVDDIIIYITKFHPILPLLHKTVEIFK